MKRLCVTIAAVMVLGHLASPVLEACGAKFLVATRVARHQRLKYAANPANILVYQHNSDAGLAEFVEKLRATLEDAGHTVAIAASVDDLRDAARTDEFNIVMMGLGEARRLRDDVGSWSPDLVVLPVMTYAARPDAARAKREFGQVLTGPALTIELLSTVHDAYAGN